MWGDEMVGQPQMPDSAGCTALPCRHPELAFQICPCCPGLANFLDSGLERAGPCLQCRAAYATNQARTGEGAEASRATNVGPGVAKRINASAPAPMLLRKVIDPSRIVGPNGANRRDNQCVIGTESTCFEEEEIVLPNRVVDNIVRFVEMVVPSVPDFALKPGDPGTCLMVHTRAPIPDILCPVSPKVFSEAGSTSLGQDICWMFFVFLRNGAYDEVITLADFKPTKLNLSTQTVRTSNNDNNSPMRFWPPGPNQLSLPSM